MKRIGLFAAALLMAPALAGAQEAPMPPPGAAAPANMPNRAAFAQLHQQARSQMLAALTPQHRALLGSIVGQLATSNAPDVQGAIRQLDAALSPREAQTILSAEASMRARMQAAMNASSAPSQSGGPAPRTHTPDAARSLLHAALGFGMMHAPGHG